jgi:hypothetical protein
VISANKPLWQQVTALVSLGASGTITGFSFVPAATADLTSPTSMPIRLMALERSVQAAPADDAALRSAIVNVANYYLRMAQDKTPAEMEAIIWQHDSIDGADHGPSCAAFASLTLELAAHVVGQRSWVTGGSSYPWPLNDWADVRVDPNPASPDIVSVLQDAQAHDRWHPLGDGYDPQPGDWVLFDGHVEVVTSYADGVLDTIGGDSLPNFSVNAHQYDAPLAAQGVAGFVDNGSLPAATGAHGQAGGYHHERGGATPAMPGAAGTPAEDADDPAIPGMPATGSAGPAASGPASRAGTAVPGAPATGQTVPETPATGQTVPGAPATGQTVPGTSAASPSIPGAPALSQTGSAAPARSSGGPAGSDTAGAAGPATPATSHTGSPSAGPATPATSHTGWPSAALGTPATSPARPHAPHRHRSAATGRSEPPADGVAAIPGVPPTSAPPAGERPAAGRPAAGRPAAERPATHAPATASPPVAGRPAPPHARAGHGPATRPFAGSRPAADPRPAASPAAAQTAPRQAGAGPADGADVPGTDEAWPSAAPVSAAASAADIPGLPGGAVARPTPPPHRHQAAPGASPAPPTNTQQTFIDEIAPGAMATQRQYGVPAAVTIAQAIDESGWGQSELSVNDHNLFGMKGTGPAGTDSLPTQEYENGQWVTIQAPFRVYNSFAESIADHGALLADSGYYTQAMADRANPDDFANALTGVYATNPEYGTDLIQIMRQFGLYRYDAAGPAAPAAAKHQPARHGPPPQAPAAPRSRSSSPAPAGRPTPSGSAPSVASPSATSPSATSPSATSPSATSPSATSPSEALPSATSPSATSPSATSPSEALPSATSPSATSPSPTSPSATSPSGTPPSGNPRSSSAPPGLTPSEPSPSAPTSTQAPRPASTPRPTRTRTPARQPTPAPEPAPPSAPAPPTPRATPAPADPTPAVPGLTPAAPGPKRTAPATAADPITLSFSYRHLPATASAEAAAGRAHTPPAKATRAPAARAHGPAAGQERQRAARQARLAPVLYHPHLPPAVKNAFVALAKAPILAMEFVYRDVAGHGGVPWELLAACDWMQCQARPRYSPVRGEKLGTVNADGTVYRTKSEALEQCVYDLVELTEEIYGFDITAQPHLSVPDLANVFAAFRWGGLLKLHHTSAMEFPYSVAGLTAQHMGMRWPNIDESRAPDRPGARFRMPFGAVPLVLSLQFPATV